MKRPTSLGDVAKRVLNRSQGFDAAMREFLDSWQSMSVSQRVKALAGEPDHIAPVHDAYLAATAEHLALSDRIETPTWTEDKARFLSEPFFAGGLESLKATLIVESPLAFRRRLIFISANALSRPRRELA
jgi:hypothetical protein